MAQAVAAGASIASTGMGIASNITQGNSSAAAMKFKAQQSERTAMNAKTNAQAVDTYYRDDLQKTLANIDAIRVAAGVDPNSPTGLALKAGQTQVSDTAREAKKYGILAQAEQDMSDANYYRYAAKQYGRMGTMSAISTGLGAVGKMAGNNQW